MQLFAGQWHPVWSKKQDCRIYLTLFLHILAKVFPSFHPNGFAEKGRKRGFVQIQSFLLKSHVTKERLVVILALYI